MKSGMMPNFGGNIQIGLPRISEGLIQTRSLTTMLLVASLFILPWGVMSLVANMGPLFGNGAIIITSPNPYPSQGGASPGGLATQNPVGPGYLAIVFVGVLVVILMFGYKGKLLARLKQLTLLLGMALLASLLYILLTSVRLPALTFTVPSLPAIVTGSILEIAAMVLLGIFLIRRYAETLSVQPDSAQAAVKSVNEEDVSYLIGSGEYRRTVISAYKSFCKVLSAVGLTNPRHKTPREFATDVEGKFSTLKEETATITRLFESARYDKKEISEDDAKLTVSELEIVKSKISGINPNEGLSK